MDSVATSGRHVVAGLDISLRGAGVVVLLPDRKTIHKTFGYGLKKPTERDRCERVLFITSNIMKMLRQHNVKYIGIENYGYATQGRLSEIAELNGAIKQQILVSLKTVALPMASGSVRSFLIPNAKQKDLRDKKSIQRYLIEQGFSCDTADEYDALACALVTDAWANERSIAITDQQLRMFDKLDSEIRRAHGS